MNTLPRLIHATVLTLLALAFSGTLVSADEHEQGGASFGLRPVRYDPNRPETESYFIYDAVPGQVIQDEALVVNQGTEAGTARIYPVDATTGQTSGTVFLSEAAPRTGIGGWTTVSETEVTLQPGEQRVIPFTVTIPQDVRAGQHVGGLVVEDTELRTGAQEGALQVQIQNRTAVAIQVNLPGPVIEQLTVTGVRSEVQQGYQMLLVGLRNDGTQMLKPAGELVIRGADGQEIQRIPFQLDTLLPETTIDYPVVVPGQALAAGSYTVAVDIGYGGEGKASVEQQLEITTQQAEQVTGSVPQLPPAVTPRADGARSPWLLPAAVAVLLIGSVALVLVFRSRSRHPAGAPASAPAAPSSPVVAAQPPQRGSIRQIRPPSRNRADTDG